MTTSPYPRGEGKHKPVEEDPTEKQRHPERGWLWRLLPKKDSLASLLIISLSLVNLNGSLSTAANNQMKTLSYVVTVRNKYKVAITTVGTKQIKYYYCLMLRKTK